MDLPERSHSTACRCLRSWKRKAPKIGVPFRQLPDQKAEATSDRRIVLRITVPRNGVLWGRTKVKGIDPSSSLIWHIATEVNHPYHRPDSRPDGTLCEGERAGRKARALVKSDVGLEYERVESDGRIDVNY